MYRPIVSAFAAIVLIGSAMVVGCETKVKADGPAPNFHEVEWNTSGFGIGEYVLHDDKRQVTCWMEKWGNGPSMYCIPDWQLSPPASKP